MRCYSHCHSQRYRNVRKRAECPRFHFKVLAHHNNAVLQVRPTQPTAFPRSLQSGKRSMTHGLATTGADQSRLACRHRECSRRAEPNPSLPLGYFVGTGCWDDQIAARTKEGLITVQQRTLCSSQWRKAEREGMEEACGLEYRINGKSGFGILPPGFLLWTSCANQREDNTCLL